MAADEEEHAALLRWAEHAARLSERYAAPPLLDRFVVAGGALVFPFLRPRRDPVGPGLLDR